jgi:PAS domain-containing protein
VLITTHRLTDDETNAVTALCRESAIALRAVEHTEQQVRQRSEDRFAALIDNSSDIVTVLGDGMELLYVSPVARRLLGYPLDDIGMFDVMDLVHPEDTGTAATMLSDIRFGVREVGRAAPAALRGHVPLVRGRGRGPVQRPQHRWPRC